MSSKKPQSRLQPRSAVNGQFVTPAYAAAHPRTTVNERLPLPGYGDTGRGGGSKK